MSLEKSESLGLNKKLLLNISRVSFVIALVTGIIAFLVDENKKLFFIVTAVFLLEAITTTIVARTIKLDINEE